MQLFESGDFRSADNKAFKLLSVRKLIVADLEESDVFETIKLK